MAGTAPFSDDPAGLLTARLKGLFKHTAWFSAVGERLGRAEQAQSIDYLSALGFPDAAVAPVADWEEAETCARNPDWNTAWWEAEEQLRAELITIAEAEVASPLLMQILSDVTGHAASAAQAGAAMAAARAAVADEALIRAAAGAGAQAAYQAALVLITGREEDHPFALKFRLFEAGRWPLGIIGSSFNIF